MAGSVEKGPRVCLLWSLVPNLCDLSPGSHPFAEPGARQAVSVREHVCVGGESGVCPGACCTRRSECRRREQPRQGAAPGLALWLRGRSGLCLQGRAGIWQLQSWLELRVSSFSPPPTPHPLSFSLAILPAVLAGRAAGTARPFPGDPSRSLIQPVREIREGRADGCRLRGKRAVTTASVKLVAEARICGWLPYSATFRLPLSVAHAGSHHRSPCTVPWALTWEESKLRRKVQWSVS